jgi:hypothetical protein
MMSPGLSTEQRQALKLLASDPYGAGEELLVVAHGFDSDMIAGLVRSGFATANRATMKARGKTAPVMSAVPFVSVALIFRLSARVEV